MENVEEKFLDKIISNIPNSSPVDVWGNDFDVDDIKKLLTDVFKKGGNEGLIKELEKYNFFVVSSDEDYPGNTSLVADLDRSVWFRINYEIEEYTFLYIECSDEYKVYLHITSAEHRRHEEESIELINTCSLETNIREVFEQTVKDYMVDVFWEKLESALEYPGVQRFISAMEERDFSKDFDTGGFFNVDGVEIPKDIKDEAYQKILKKVEENPQEK